MTPDADALFPENYDRWPRQVQRRYIAELYALYFPDVPQQAGTTTAAIAEAEIIPFPRSETRNPRDPNSPDGRAS